MRRRAANRQDEVKGSGMKKKERFFFALQRELPAGKTSACKYTPDGNSRGVTATTLSITFKLQSQRASGTGLTYRKIERDYLRQMSAGAYR